MCKLRGARAFWTNLTQTHGSAKGHTCAYSCCLLVQRRSCVAVEAAVLQDAIQARRPACPYRQDLLLYPTLEQNAHRRVCKSLQLIRIVAHWL